MAEMLGCQFHIDCGIGISRRFYPETGCNSRGLRAGDRDSAYGIVRVGGVCESVVIKKRVDVFLKGLRCEACAVAV
jgi:hypothetical protein